MIPLPPLDGSKVLMAFLPDEMAYKLESIQRYSFIILIALVMTPVLGYILIPLQRLFLGIFSTVLSIVFAI
jgi:Zn-dependent protease